MQSTIFTTVKLLLFLRLSISRGSQLCRSYMSQKADAVKGDLQHVCCISPSKAGLRAVFTLPDPTFVTHPVCKILW